MSVDNSVSLEYARNCFDGVLQIADLKGTCFLTYRNKPRYVLVRIAQALPADSHPSKMELSSQETGPAPVKQGKT